MKDIEVRDERLGKVVGGSGNGYQTDWRWVVDDLIPAHMEELVAQLPSANLQELQDLKNNKKASETELAIWGVANSSYPVVAAAVARDVLRNA